MIKIVEFFKKLNWFERIFPIVGLIAVSLSFALSPDRFWLSFVYSLVGIIETFLVAKGFFIAPFVTLVVSILYLFLLSLEHFLKGFFYVFFCCQNIIFNTRRK